ncbi:MAG: LysR family transcriptional regulator [Rhizobiales bacterium 24-66-13]|nr:MAG: LysR family transcriptional regulator [Rhizobiales bacterium 35-66-30]OYZ82093.1 MAG: LysR family transcriptional regulator [Rhizobiales bacterium 24-66-13]OZB11067.1 MAG: LysR family transcriptional regulator [Rhizobiales bacterium 39-66-18]
MAAKAAKIGWPMKSRLAKRHEAIEIRHLSYFVAAAEQGSFRKAGVALEVQESAISRCVRDLEDHVGASLFHRRSCGVTLTYAGQRFLPQARRILRDIGHSVEDVARIGRVENGRLKIGIFSSLSSGFLADLLHAYDSAHAKVEIEFIEGNPDEHIAAVRQFQIDVAFLTGTRVWPGCETDQLWFERVFVVLPEGHGLSERTVLSWSDLSMEQFIVSDVAPGPEIHDYLVKRLADLGHHPYIQPQSVGRDNLLSLVAVGRGLTVVSEAMVAARLPGITYRPITDEILPFSAIWSAKNDNPAFRRLLSMARKMSRSAMTYLIVLFALPI